MTGPRFENAGLILFLYLLISTVLWDFYCGIINIEIQEQR